MLQKHQPTKKNGIQATEAWNYISEPINPVPIPIPKSDAFGFCLASQVE